MNLTKNINFLFLLIFISCKTVSIEKKINMNWTEFDLDMPHGISIYQGQNNKLPLKAWVAIINLNSDQLFVDILSSNDKDGKETPMQFIENHNSLIVINGGFFNSKKNPAQHVGLLKTNGFLEEPASHSIIRDSERYFITRGAFGISKNGIPDIAWCSTKNDTIYEWNRPHKNRPGFPNKKIDFNIGTPWDMYEALHAGPVLIKDGDIDITVEDEVFFNTSVAGIQPRSAVGYTKNNKLILMIVDGRQIDSRGVYLEELAIMMKEFNCIEALNLDGGGSSAMIADSRLLNRPSGLTAQREIMSAIAINYRN